MKRSFILLLLAGACADAPPVRLVAGRADTVVVHSRQAVSLPVFGFDRKGDTVDVRNLRFRRVSGAPIRVTSSGMATCDRAGDVNVEASYRRVSTSFLLQCRPILGFRFGGNVRMILGGPPVPMPLDPVGMDGESVFPVVGTATVEDSSVVTVRGMDIAAKGPGRTNVHVEAGDCRTEINVEVNERVASLDGLEPFQEFVTPVSLVGGEIKTWTIPKGDYQVDFTPTRAAGQTLTVGAAGAQCMGSIERGYHCLALNPSKIVLRNAGEAGSGAVTGELSVRVLGDTKRRSLRLVRHEPRRRGPPCSDFRFRGLSSTPPTTSPR